MVQFKCNNLKMKKLIYFLVIILLTSCVSTRKLKNISNKQYLNSTFKKAIYSNCPQEGCGSLNRSLINQLTFKFIKKDTINNWQELNIELIKQRKSLGINIYEKDSLIRTQQLRGKWKNDCFTQKE